MTSRRVAMAFGIVGGIVALAVGVDGIPAAWRQARERLGAAV